MSNGEILDFNVMRIQSELDRYQRTKTLPHALLEGTYSISEISELYLDKLAPEYRDIANELYKEYYGHLKSNIKSLRSALTKDYTSIMQNLATTHDSFWFKEIMNLYRPGMNPVRALYYQTREVTRSYNPEDPHHYWLKDLITDKEFNNILLDSLHRDVKKLERIIKRYYFPITEVTDDVPLELFHAKQQLKDFRHYYLFFRSTKNWNKEFYDDH